MKKILSIIGIAVAVTLFQSCKEDWLTPKPLSFFSPENTYVDEDGFMQPLPPANATCATPFSVTTPRC